ncbi:hypothetical protein C0Q70_03718 [Pomacea canaliculata]|uniref:Uncharacterized protein n=1 Tax=Pomacea canaliculata TaxID=400727 RepID=A0A2T7PTH7_POMCA|nr:hypothetical protein C0Q70_03718 [Pomacea canaliculata]
MASCMMPDKHLLGSLFSLTKRDVEDHAAHPSTESRNFELRLTSGERLRMSVQKRSAMSPDVTVVERVSGREELRRPQVRDCFFSGGLEGEEGHASLSLCDGQVTGGIHTKNRDIQLQALPELHATRRRREAEHVRVLVTSSPGTSYQTLADDVLKRMTLDKSGLKYNPEGLNAGEFENLTVEVGVYLDRAFIRRVEEKLGLNTTQQLTDLVALKWSGISALMSNPWLVGWNMAFKVVHLEIWREIPGHREQKDGLVLGEHHVQSTLALLRGQRIELKPLDRGSRNGPQEQICKSLTCIRRSPVPELATMSAVLGTPCAKEKMCYENGCVPWVNSLNPKYLRSLEKDNQWGPWSEFSPCEGRCGVAVSVSTRRCNTPEPYLAPFCHGDSIKAKVCPFTAGHNSCCHTKVLFVPHVCTNLFKACSNKSSEESELVRQQANTICSKMKATSSFAYNLTGEGLVRSTTGEVDKCTVTCVSLSKQLPNSFLLPDGTPCTGTDTDKSLNSLRDISWRCVHGRCLAFGCNGKSLGDGGGVEKDECGVCGGDGSSCEKTNRLTNSPDVEP